MTRIFLSGSGKCADRRGCSTKLKEDLFEVFKHKTQVVTCCFNLKVGISIRAGSDKKTFECDEGQGDDEHTCPWGGCRNDDVSTEAVRCRHRRNFRANTRVRAAVASEVGMHAEWASLM